MAVIKRRGSPVDYRLCDQTVTVYRWNGSVCKQFEVSNAFFDFQKTQNVGKTGSTEANSFLLVIPGDSVKLSVGDKVLRGNGRLHKIATREEWAAFVPSKVSGLVVVKTVDVKYWNGVVAHTEAGG